MNIEVSLGGLKLKTPFIVSSCSLTEYPDKNLEFEKAGAGAIVLKSIFEEEILNNSSEMDLQQHAEAYEYFQYYNRENALDEYCKLIADTKKICSIPVIASVNCNNAEGWPKYAKRFQQEGADAIELNVMTIDSNINSDFGTLEQNHINILKAVKAQVDIPIIMKIGQNITNVIALADKLKAYGAAAVVLFNKMCPTDIDIKNIKLTKGEILSSNTEIYNSLRWTSLVSAKVPNFNVLTSGGILDGASFVKAILAGATAVEVCSVLYKKGPEALESMVEFLKRWMTEHGFDTVSEICGLLNAKNNVGGDNFERVQFYRNISRA